jgi:hypothetical protein
MSSPSERKKSRRSPSGDQAKALIRHAVKSRQRASSRGAEPSGLTELNNEPVESTSASFPFALRGRVLPPLEKPFAKAVALFPPLFFNRPNSATPTATAAIAMTV